MKEKDVNVYKYVPGDVQSVSVQFENLAAVSLRLLGGGLAPKLVQFVLRKELLKLW